MSTPSGVVTHDWIEKRGGAEKVLTEIMGTFPNASVLTLWNKADDDTLEFSVRESVLAKTFLSNHKALALLFMPIIWRTMKVPESAWLLSSTHAFAHFARKPKYRGVLGKKLLYVHTPVRYVWAPDLDQRGAGFLARLVSVPLRYLDKKVAREADAIAANSRFVQSRILRTWGLNSKVIYPPVNVEYFIGYSECRADELSAITGVSGRFALAASRFVPYKDLKSAILACADLGFPLVVAGAGPEEAELRTLALDLGSEVIFVIDPSDEQLAALYAQAEVFIFPAVEDFGIMPVEAMASGTPVVVNSTGGASESVLTGVTGEVFEGGDIDSLKSAIVRASGLSKMACIDQARKFSAGRFRDEISNWVAHETN